MSAVWSFVSGKLGFLGLVVAVGLYIAVLFTRSQLSTARFERDIARAETVAMRAAFEGEKASTGVAVDAATRCAADGADNTTRATRALASVRADLDRARVQLRACVTPEAVAARMGALFPVSQ